MSSTPTAIALKAYCSGQGLTPDGLDPKESNSRAARPDQVWGRRRGATSALCTPRLRAGVFVVDTTLEPGARHRHLRQTAIMGG